ncbi:thioredoxin family protein [Synechococcus sp. BS56D]|jgi:hypothetical protein|uniref:thioredoxin family protein n=1 Tax=Synechococcus sp. BS56D TaxID=2055944 RepID=UPI001038BAC6|nr:thioredoxin family protein [Synechococcus sp. BS56D]TCD57649.1 thioredoxin family protein [Synechococcus sp. BS56D]
MVLTPSTMLPLGSALPAFSLPIATGTGPGATHLSSGELPQQPLLLMLLCSHCPFVKHIEAELSRLDLDYGDRVSLVAVASNSWITHPEDGPEALARQAQANGWRFPYGIDQEQTLAKALRAACTPEFYLFSPPVSPPDQTTVPSAAPQILRYRGQLDGSRPGNGLPVTGSDLRSALQAVLTGGTPSADQQASIGCNIKWHPGQEPPWFSGSA